VVRRRGLVDRRGERLVRAAARIGAGLEQVVEALVAEALDLRLGERRVEGDLREELERGLETRRRNVDADARRVPAGVGVERRAEPLRGLDEGDGVEAGRALVIARAARTVAPGVGRRLVGRAVSQDERRRHERSPGQVGDDDADPISGA
jgi:hypothetical protein